MEPKKYFLFNLRQLNTIEQQLAIRVKVPNLLPVQNLKNVVLVKELDI